MNLHDIGRSEPDPNLLNQWWPSQEAMNLRDTSLRLSRYQQEWMDAYIREYMRNPSPMAYRQQVEGTFVSNNTRDVPPTPTIDVVPLGRAILTDILRYRDNLLRSGMRQEELRNTAFLVNPQQMYALRDELGRDVYSYGLDYDHGRGNLVVHGVNVMVRQERA